MKGTSRTKNLKKNNRTGLFSFCPWFLHRHFHTSAIHPCTVQQSTILNGFIIFVDCSINTPRYTYVSENSANFYEWHGINV